MKSSFLSGLAFVILSGCAEKSIVEIPKVTEMYKEEMVSMSSLVSLSRTSYILGCMESPRNGSVFKGQHAKCRTLGEKYIKNELLPLFKKFDEVDKKSSKK